MSKKIIVAIDGPAGSGKSVSAKLLAKKLGIAYLDTGAMYRAATFLALTENVLNDPDKLIRLLKNSVIDLKYSDEKLLVYLNSRDVTEEIRNQDVNFNVSEISKIPEVRQLLVGKQQEYGKNNSLVAEGRDIGTAVFPGATVKFFLTASIEERAKRRRDEFNSKGENFSFEEIKEAIRRRDKIDSERELNPLKKADDAIEIDTSKMTIEEQVEKMASEINKKLKTGK
ncbi:MAG TPA: (d)CMP kinase [Ignavibacteriales bacterium]|nr:(d)CMP kinase [Ignavibacteriales bacterium]